MASSLLRKFKVIRCPLDNEVLRPRAFITHVKNRHQKHSQQWAKQVQKEESCLICTSSEFHSQPKVELAAPTRHGNDNFITKHAAHLPSRQATLSEIDKEIVRQKLFANNVDIDASPPPPPPPPPVVIPSPRQAVGVVENWQNLITPEAAQEEEESKLQTTIMTGLSSPFTHVVDASTPQMDINKLESSLYLDEHNPLHVEPEAAQLLNDTYRLIYEPGLQYPKTTLAPNQHHVSTNTSVHVLPEFNEQSIQVDAPSLHHASTSMSELSDEAKKMADNRETSAAPETTDATNTEDIPLLTQGIEHIREVNKMKNVMLTQIMQDNIDLLESKVQSRKRALQFMEDLFEARTQTERLSDDVTLELSRIIHLKNKFIQQLLRESAHLHPQVYTMMQD